MKKLFTLSLGCAAALSAAAYQYVDPASVTWQQTPKQPYVTIGYTLQGASAFVNVEVLTNGVSVGTIPAEDLTGDVNALVAAGAHTFTWHVTNEALLKPRLPEGAWSFKLKVQSREPRATYMAVTLASGAIAFYASESALPYAIGDAAWRTTHMLFRRIPAAMTTARLGLGATDYRNSAYSYVPAYERTFTNDYYMAVFETTIGQYMALGYANPAAISQASYDGCTSGTHKSVHQTDWVYHPVERLSSNTALEAGAKLTALVAGSGLGLTFTVPTEDEWEFACRGGRSSDVWTGIPANNIIGTVNRVYVNFQTSKNYYGGGNPGYHPSYSDNMPVGLLDPNPWGLYDTLGNVREWVIPQYGGGAVMRGGYHGMSGENMTAPCREFATNGDSSDGATGVRFVCRLPNE